MSRARATVWSPSNRLPGRTGGRIGLPRRTVRPHRPRGRPIRPLVARALHDVGTPSPASTRMRAFMRPASSPSWSLQPSWPVGYARGGDARRGCLGSPSTEGKSPTLLREKEDREHYVAGSPASARPEAASRSPGRGRRVQGSLSTSMMGLAGDDGADAWVEQRSLEGRRGGGGRVARGGAFGSPPLSRGLTMGKIGSGDESGFISISYLLRRSPIA